MNIFSTVLRITIVFLSSSASVLAAPSLNGYLRQPDAWFASAEAQSIADNLLSWQAAAGSWPKNTDTMQPFAGDRARLRGTFDNRATVDEVRFLARAYQATRDARYKEAVVRAIDHIVAAQYPTGGWPQYFPSQKNYTRHITFNDQAMMRLMELLREVSRSERFDFVDADRRQKAAQAFDRGVECILKCQVVVAGKRTVWCAQHDEQDYHPRPARTFELVSLSGAESVGITRLLMSLETPTPEVIEAVESAVAWFKQAELRGIRIKLRDDARSPRGKDKVVVEDPDAPPLWARFYEIETGRPLFVDRDGVPKYRLADIGFERRNNYAWYGDWPRELLEKEYPAWKQRLTN